MGVAKGTGLHAVLLTNGTYLDETTIKSLIASRLDILKVSLWASSPEEYARNYPGTNPDNFPRVVEGLKLLAGSRRLTKAIPLPWSCISR